MDGDCEEYELLPGDKLSSTAEEIIVPVCRMNGDHEKSPDQP